MLADLVANHRQALEYELMTRSQFTLDDLGCALSEGALFSFVSYLPQDSELWRETHTDEAKDSYWSGTQLLAHLLATLIDELRSFAWLYASANSKHSPQKPDLIERPGVVNKNTRDKKVYGHDPIPMSQFNKFWEGGD